VLMQRGDRRKGAKNGREQLQIDLGTEGSSLDRLIASQTEHIDECGFEAGPDHQQRSGDRQL